MNRDIKRMMYITMLIAMSVLLHLVESMIPIPLPIPGIKLGFANVVGLITYFLFGFKTMVGVNLSRVLLASLLHGTLFGTPFYMSLAGVSVSTCMVGIVGKILGSKKCLVVSVASAITHIIGQIIMAFFIMNTTMIFYYFPILLFFSIPTGVFTGMIATQVLQRIQYSFRREL
ncbi:MAG: Gx transporter family protein [Erysipelotrichaceae bacterium]|nr:Gx transporter family protein [Erysipelotrichaceae bacterium]MBR3693691.1 Gx transporter family protein [Erysipelotrichales bacterium]